MYLRKRKEREVRLTEAHTRTLISVVVEMSRLLGPSAEMRPVLESLFHRTLICSQPKNRQVQNLLGYTGWFTYSCKLVEMTLIYDVPPTCPAALPIC